MTSTPHNPVGFVTFTTSAAKASGIAKLCFMLLKYCKTFDSLSYFIHSFPFLYHRCCFFLLSFLFSFLMLIFSNYFFLFSFFFFIFEWRICDNTPSATVYLLTSCNNSVSAGDSSSCSDRGITHFFTAQEIQPREWEKKNKEQMNNKGLGQLKVQERELCNTAFPVYLQTNASVYF